jgi:hypothetical protein
VPKLVSEYRATKASAKGFSGLQAITEADVAQRILACLNLPTRAPPLAMSRPGGRVPTWPEREAPSAAETDALWSAFEFDQSTPAEWDVGA